MRPVVAVWWADLLLFTLMIIGVTAPFLYPLVKESMKGLVRATPRDLQGRKVLVNLIGPMFGLLRPWDIVMERRWYLVVLWGFLPTVYLMIGRIGLFTDEEIGFLFLWLALVAAYFLGWFASSIWDAIAWCQSEKGRSIWYDGARLVLVVLAWSWVPASAIWIIGPIGNYETLTLWSYVYAGALGGAVGAVALHATTAAERRCSTRERWAAFAPFVGLLGAPYLFRGAYLKGITLMLVGFSIIAYVAWLSLYRVGIENEPLNVFSIYPLAVVYLVSWLWPHMQPSRHIETVGDRYRPLPD